MSNSNGHNPYAWLARHASAETSQWGECGILRAIFERIGTAHRYCVDVGASDGLQFSNVRPFIEEGWSAALLEADESRFHKLASNSQRFIEQPVNGQVVRCGNYTVVPSGAFSIDHLLSEQFNVPVDFDLLSVDVDSSEYWLFNSLLKYQPRVVVIEYDPNVDDDFLPAFGDQGQAGIRPLLEVGHSKGYVPVCRTQTNVIFVKRELVGLIQNEGEIDETGKDQQIKIKAVMSVPRYGSMAARGIIEAALRPFHIPLETSQGVFWDQCLQKHFLDARAQDVDWLLTIDFDSTFTSHHLDRLFHWFGSRPEIDAIVALQARRAQDFPLLTVKGETQREIDGDPFQVTTAHFGLSLFRMDALAKVHLPWFFGLPNIYGHWSEGKPDEYAQPIPWLVEAWSGVSMADTNPECELDPDIFFWHQWKRAGNTVYCAPDVRIGHGEELLRVFDEHMEPCIMTVPEWRNQNLPSNGQKKLRTSAVL